MQGMDPVQRLEVNQTGSFYSGFWECIKRWSQNDLFEVRPDEFDVP